MREKEKRESFEDKRKSHQVVFWGRGSLNLSTDINEGEACLERGDRRLMNRERDELCATNSTFREGALKLWDF